MSVQGLEWGWGEVPAPSVAFPEPLLAFLLVLMAAAFYGARIPAPPPTWAAALLPRSQTLHAISRLSAFALAVPQPNAFPIVPVVPQPPRSSGPNSDATLPPCSFPRAPALAPPSTFSWPCTCASLSLCAESTLGFASWTEVEHILPYTLPHGPGRGARHLVGTP